MKKNFRERIVLMSTAGLIAFAALGFRFLPVVSSENGPAANNKSAMPVTVVAKGRGFPRISFADGQNVSLGAERDASGPGLVAMATADFDSDGVDDLVAVDKTGAARVFKGNAAVIDPVTEPGSNGDATGEILLDVGRSISLPIVPDFFEAGDFNADGHADILAAARGGTVVYLAAGDGAGGFTELSDFGVGGSITALRTGEIGRADQQADLAVAVHDGDSSFVAVYEHPTGAFARPPERVKLSAPATDIALGFLESDSFADIAVAAGNNLTVIRGRGQVDPWDMIDGSGVTRPAPIVETRLLPFQIAGLEIGYFTERRGQSLVMVSAAGDVFTLDMKGIAPAPLPARGTLTRIDTPKPPTEALRDGRKFSSFLEYREPMRRLNDDSELMFHLELIPGDVTDIDAYRVGLAEKRAAALAEMSPEARAARTEVERKDAERSKLLAITGFLDAVSPGPAAALARWELKKIGGAPQLGVISATGFSRKLTKLRVSDSGRDELAVIDPATNRVHLLIRENLRRTADPAATEIVSLDCPSAPLAVMPMRLNIDGVSDLVILQEGAAVPSVVLSVPAATFTVTTLADEDDGSCDASCSLREAIDAANNSAGTDTIEFAVTGPIQPSASLPEIEFPVTINGTNAPVPLVEINGSFAPLGSAGILINAANVVVRRLSVTGFRQDQPDPEGPSIGGQGITIYNFEGSTLAAFNRIEGCYLGTDFGTADRGNESSGLQIFDSDNNVIGGNTAAARNVISGNGRGEIRGSTIDAPGIQIIDGRFTTVRGNYIGTNSSGTAPLPNSIGMFAVGSNNEYGGDPAGSMNVISGNRHLTAFIENVEDPNPCFGVGIYEVSALNETTGEWITHDNQIKGNRVGTNANGNAAVGNCRTGITPVRAIRR